MTNDFANGKSYGITFDKNSNFNLKNNYYYSAIVSLVGT